MNQRCRKFCPLVCQSLKQTNKFRHLSNCKCFTQVSDSLSIVKIDSESEFSRLILFPLMMKKISTTLLTRHMSSRQLGRTVSQYAPNQCLHSSYSNKRSIKFQSSENDRYRVKLWVVCQRKRIILCGSTTDFLHKGALLYFVPD